MRVLTFLHSFEPGGVERVALRLVRQWRAQGVDAPLFMGRTSGAMREELGAGLACHVPRQPRISTARFETLWMILTLPPMIRRTRPDALFCAGNSYAIIAVAMKLLLGQRCPPILVKISNDLTRRDMAWPARLAYRLWLRAQGRFIDHFIALAEGLDREITTLVRPRRNAISTIPSPALSRAQIGRLRSLPARPRQHGGGVRFVTIGRLARQKNLPLMVEAFRRSAGQNDRLTIYGDGPERSALKRRADRLGLGDRVHFAGHVPDPAERLGEADIFLLSSDYEGVPAVILEALAAGLPIIATDCSAAMRPLLRNGALGRLIRPGDVRSFADAIGAAGSMSQDSAASLEQALRFTIDDAGHSYLDLFAKMTVRPLGRRRACISGPNPQFSSTI